MKGKDRNKPCWCGSNIKYKACHYSRDTQETPSKWSFIEKNKKNFTQKKCLAKDKGIGSCAGSIIRAHSISKSANLKPIASNGRVLHYSANIKMLIENNGKLSINEIGIQEASTFNGFCSQHDKKLFSCLENEKFQSRYDQCLAIFYRSLAYTTYGKDAMTHLRETLRIADKGRNLEEQIAIQELLNQINLGNELSRKECKHTIDILSDALANKKKGVIHSLILEFDEILPFMCSSAWSPLTDLYENRLQINKLDTKLEQICFSSFAVEEKSYICISWLNTKNAAGERIANQIHTISKDLKAKACLLFVLKHSENVFFNPNWYEALNPSTKKALQEFAMDGLDPAASIPSKPIPLEIDLNLPITINSHYIT